ncbi:hypothetical protein [Peloplasma aerotolerans]|uniref:Uncharacterized protein n=1 Tax=Peloplasma aerotolerans TaxID=3044389 RepID=A0AAW6UDX3_9MOLU|nr:hypothetical protein [Mariniplasma sp. M4Ah]MDI6453819.1 hypothetical protein [Mariniplasma sp. M4Ah]
MKKTTKVLGFISLFFAVFSALMLGQFLFGTASGDWSDLGFFLIAIIFAIAAVILTIPFLFIIFKVKIRDMKFYFFSHLSLIVVSALTIAIALSIT